MTGTDNAAQDRTPVLLLKTKSKPNDGYEEQFSGRHDGGSFEPVFVPVLEHQFVDAGLQTTRELLQQRQIGRGEGKKYGGLIFTSQRAVEVFARLVSEGTGAEPPIPDCGFL